MKHSLLLGNGINRCIISQIAWDDLLANLASEYGVNHNPDLSFPLGFECIANQILKESDKPSDTIYDELKEKIVAQIDKCILPVRNPHSKLCTMPIDSILTTNYDYLIEQSLDLDFSTEIIKRLNSDRYNLHSCNSVSNVSIYHIHGECKYIGSICLGYEHYAGLLQNLRYNYAIRKRDSGDLKIKSLLMGDELQSIWSDCIFLNNLDIVGFGLSMSEIDIWWLLTYRAYLYYSNKDGLRQYIKNKIVFHHVSTEIDINMKFALEKVHVDYSFIRISNNDDESYLNGYLQIADSIK